MKSAFVALLSSCVLSMGCANGSYIDESDFQSTGIKDKPASPNGEKCDLPPNPPACGEQSECFRDLCTDSQCVDGHCVHVKRDDGLNCIGAPTPDPADIFIGICECGKCQPPQ